jgi:hypothetical protein
LKASFPIVRVVGSSIEIGIPIESKTAGRARHTLSALYGILLTTDGSFPPSATLWLPAGPETRMIDDAGAGAELDVEPAQAAARTRDKDRSSLRTRMSRLGFGWGAI